MKALFTILVLAVIVFAYVISTSFYVKGDLVLAYSLMLTSIASLVLWIRSISLTKALVKA